jgi:PAS domain S-box-containing protein
MARKLTYEELEQKVKELEKEASKRKQAEEKLKGSEKRFRQFFENEPAYCYMISPEGLIIDVNSAALKTLGYMKQEIVGKSVEAIYAPEVLPKAKKLFMKWGKIGKLKDEELVIITKKGNRRTVILSADVVKGKDGKILHSVSVQKDITERKRAEEALRKKTRDLGERVKELNCLYNISHLLEKPDIALEEILQETVNLVPLSWQYPEITCARLILQDQIFTTDNFNETVWKQASDIMVHGERIGTLEIIYLEERPDSDEGPFLKEERELINAIVKRLGKVIELKQAEVALKQERDKLQDALAKIKTLSGLLPICAACKKIRDDKGYWNQIEVYIRDHSEADFSHSICPECAKKLYPEFYSGD